ncbi:MAG TPA: SDR family oxidoreductase [Terriglobales bacterium]|nr:SDR family oxidoreductase [Terriglobales bacterium]
MALYLITGAAGFIGSNLARTLLARGEKVRGIDNFSSGKRDNLVGLETMDLVAGDINDTGLMNRVCVGVDYVLHQAALPSVPRSVKDPVSTHQACLSGTLSVLIAARDAKVKRVVYAGSSSAYGDSPTLPKDEEMLPRPISPYAVAKLGGELYMQCFWRVYGLETVTLRYFNVFGPYQDPTSFYSGVLARFTMQMLRGEQPTIFGDGEQSRDFTYIENVVEANLLTCTAPAEKVAGMVFNAATGTRITLNEIFRVLCDLTGYKGVPEYGPVREGDIKDSLADISLAREALGYVPKIDFRDGLRRTVEWYRSQPAAIATQA